MSQVATVQMQNTPHSVAQRLKSERVEEALKAMPAWKLLPGGKAIDRAFAFPSPRVAAAYAGFVSTYAAEVGHALTLDLAREQVVVTLIAPRRRGRQGDLTEAMLAFAQQLG